jgi:hypothetical protein
VTIDASPPPLAAPFARVGALATVMLLAVLIAAACTGHSPEPSPPPIAKSPGRITFTPVTKRAGLGLPATPSWGSTFVDADLNGSPDLVVNRHKRHARFFTSSGSTFERALEAELVLNEPSPGRLIYDRHGCAWGEADGNGVPDLYCGSGAQDGRGSGPNRLWLSGPAGLVDHAQERRVDDPLGRARSVHWLDYDSDEDLDLYVANEIRSGVPNRLYQNTGDGFVAVESDASSEIATRSSTWSDWDVDGDPDLLVLGHGFVGSRAYENRGGVFREIHLPRVTGRSWLSASWGELASDAYPDIALVSEERLLVLRRRRRETDVTIDTRLRAGRVAQWLDVENDGDLDLFLIEGAVGDPPRPNARNHEDSLWLNTGARLVRTAVPSLDGPSRGNGDSVSVADYDGDGRVDLFVTNGYLDVFGRSMLFANRSVAGNWIAVRLVGGPNNPFAYGARLLVRSNDLRRWHQVTDGVAFTSQSQTNPVHFGLGSRETATIKVLWPDGTRDCISVRGGETQDITPGSHGC